MLRTDRVDARPLVGRDLSDAIRAAKPAAPSEPVLFTTDDEISEGSMPPASPFQRVAPRAGTDQTWCNLRNELELGALLCSRATEFDNPHGLIQPHGRTRVWRNTVLERRATVPEAVMFDLDGVLVDSEQLWNEAKQALVRAAGGRWRADAPRAMMGMSAPEWSAYMREQLGVDRDADEINRDVVGRMERLYRAKLPLLPGAVEAVRALHDRWPLGLATSSNREIITLVLDVAGLADAFVATVSSEEVQHGKPAPDVYLEAARRVGVEPGHCVAIEDSSNGLRAAAAAGMAVIAVPNAHYPPDEDALALASASVSEVGEVTPDLVERVSERPEWR